MGTPDKQNYATAEGTPEYKIINNNGVAIRQIRGSLSFLSDAVRLNVSRWCIKAEGNIDQPGLLPWEQLKRILGGRSTDMDILCNNCNAFKDYIDKATTARLVAIDIDAEDPYVFSSPPPPPIVHRRKDIRKAIRGAYANANTESVSARKIGKQPGGKIQKAGE